MLSPTGIRHWVDGIARLLDNDVHKLIAAGALITGFFGAVLIYREVIQSWLLLARSLPRHGRMPRSVQAAAILGPLIGRGIKFLSIYKAARYRIEIELLRPVPERPLRLKERDNYRSAIAKWRKDKKAWSKVTNGILEELVQEDKLSRSIEVDNCSELIDKPEIEKYFDAMVHRHFVRRQPPAFLAKVAFRSGFIAPLHLITGVLARYEEDWGPVIDGYGRSVIRHDDEFRFSPARELQAFIFDCWLLWGPSIPICTCPEWHGEVALQYGFGDEDNSLILRCPNPEILRLLGKEAQPIPMKSPGDESETHPTQPEAQPLQRDPHDGKPKAPDDEQSERKGKEEVTPMARRVRVSGTLKWGAELPVDAICPAQRAIWKDQRLVLDIAENAPAESIRVAGGTEEQVFQRYYSAYLWIAFVMCKSQDNEDTPFNYEEKKWRDIIPFFTHANIASSEIYHIHRDQLARSALEGALQMLETHSELVLRFACAVDESGCGYELLHAPPSGMTIRQKMHEFAGDLAAQGKPRELLDRLRLGDKDTPLEAFMDGDYSSCALPGIVNEYFEEIDDATLTCHELHWSHKEDRRLLKQFYKDCIVPEVPNPNERDSFEQIRDNLRRKEKGKYAKKKNNYHVVVVQDDDGTPIGGAIADYLFQQNAGVIEYLIVQPDHREGGVGSKLLEFTERLLHDDADKVRRLLGVNDDGTPEAEPSYRFREVEPKFMHEIVKCDSALDWIIAELPDPYLTPVLTNQLDPFRRAWIWHNWDYKVLDFPYVQPALDKKRRPVENLLVMAKPCENSRFGKPVAIPADNVCDVVTEYAEVAMPDAPDRERHLTEMFKLFRENPQVDLVSFDEYLGWKKGLYISEAVSSNDPVVDDVKKVCRSLFTNGATNADGSQFEDAFKPRGVSRRSGYRYHLWALRTEVGKECVGMASFLTMPSAGFGNYLGFVESARSGKLLPQLVARIEEQMVRDRMTDDDDVSRDPRLLRRLVVGIKNQVARLRDVSQPNTETPRGGWYLECPDTTKDALRQLNSSRDRKCFWELDVKYRRPTSGESISLMYKPFGRVYEPPSIGKDAFLQAVREIYTSVYAIAEPDNDKVFGELSKSLNGVDSIESRRLADEPGLAEPVLSGAGDVNPL